MARSVVIVGGGVVGAFTAYSLAGAGWGVTVLDRGTLGGGCSAGNCGYVCPSHVLPLAAPGALASTLKTLLTRNSPLKVRPGFALRNLGWFLRFARRCNRTDMLHAALGIQALLNSSRRLYDTLLENEGLNVEWDMHGLLFAFHTAKAFEHYVEVNHLLGERFAMPAERYDADEMLELEPSLKPDVAVGGYLYKSDAQLRPDVLMAQMRKVLERMGVAIVEGCTITGIAGQGTAKAVQTTRGEFAADAFVFATGAWTPQLAKALGGRVPIIPGKGYSITVPRPAICPTYPMIFEEHRVAVSPFQSGLRIGSTMEFAGYETSMNPKRLQLLRDAAAFYLRDPGLGGPEEPWWGWRPMTPDGNPVIDHSPKFANVVVAAGHGMLGLSMAPGTGRLVKEMLGGEPPHVDAGAYSWR